MLYSIVLVILLILDQGLKYWTTSTLELDVGVREVIPNLFSFMNVHNTGVAFGLFKDSPELFRWILVGVALVFSVVAGILIARHIVKGAFGRWTMLLMIAGALGNCIDRIINGFVVDMLRVDFFDYIFNLADVYLTVGGILFCLYVIFYKKPEDELYPEQGYENTEKPKKRKKRGEENVYDDRTASQQNAEPSGRRRPVKRPQQEYDLSHHTANIETIKMPKLSPAEVTSVLHPIPPSMYENRDNTLPRQPYANTQRQPQMHRPDGQRPPQRQGTQPLPNMQRPHGGTQPLPNTQRPHSGTQPLPNMQRPGGTQPLPNMQNTQRQPGVQRPRGGTQPLPNMQNTQRQPNMQRPQNTHPLPNMQNTQRQPNMQRPQNTHPLPNMQNTQRQPNMQRPQNTNPLPNMQNTQRQPVMQRPQDTQRQGSYAQPGYAQPQKEEFSLEDIMAEFSDN